jgi:hypothetical protein
VVAPIAYLDAADGRAGYRVWPSSTGRPPETPAKRHHDMPIRDCRPVAADLALDREGFEFRAHATSFRDFYDDEAVRARYYGETAALLGAATGATAVLPFDHNVRSAKAAAEGRPGIRTPVDMAHNDYTESSGPRRTREILEAAGRSDLAGRRAALVNVWRPIRGPVRDVPLAVCEAESVVADDFVPTAIEHYGEDDLERPHLSGEIYSFRHRPDHRWFYVSDMQPDEVLFLKCFDSARDGRARYTAHTGFVNPERPPDAVPRESIEVRTLVVY